VIGAHVDTLQSFKKKHFWAVGGLGAYQHVVNNIYPITFDNVTTTTDDDEENEKEICEVPLDQTCEDEMEHYEMFESEDNNFEGEKDEKDEIFFLVINDGSLKQHMSHVEDYLLG
jgi:signal transduction protein with GAF and PtsI domain